MDRAPSGAVFRLGADAVVPTVNYGWLRSCLTALPMVLVYLFTQGRFPVTACRWPGEGLASDPPRSRVARKGTYRLWQLSKISACSVSDPAQCLHVRRV